MMGLLSKIFGSKKDVSNVDIDNKAKSSVKNVPRNENCIKLMEFASHMEMLSIGRYWLPLRMEGGRLSARAGRSILLIEQQTVAAVPEYF